MRDRRKSISPDQRQPLNQRILNHLFQWDGFIRATTVHCYISLKEEVDTLPVFEECWRLGKTTLVPWLDPQTDHMQSAFWQPGQPLAHSPSNGSAMDNPTGSLTGNRLFIPQPHHPAPPEISPELILVPGVGFDLHGRRLGYGKGYYDRFLSRWNPQAHPPQRPIYTGLTFSIQIVSTLPHDPWDIPLDFLVSEQGVSPIQKK